MVVDGHLDIAYNVLAEGCSFDGPSTPGYLVNRQALAAADVGLVVAVLFAEPFSPRRPFRLSYRSAREASLLALAQLGFYRATIPIIRCREDLEGYLKAWTPGQLACVVLMEGADPVLAPNDLSQWTAAGVRMIGLAWNRTRYASGAGSRFGEGRPQSVGLTAQGRRLLDEMSRQSMVLDVSHLSDRALVEALEIWKGPIVASHSNAREIVHREREISAATVGQIAARGGVVGVSFFSRHLRPRGRATLDDVVAHIVHHVRSAGSPEHVVLGTDLDGGFLADAAAIDSLADLGVLKTRLQSIFNRSDVDGILGDNWLAFLLRSLPRRAPSDVDE
jgi:membrane dipeptidase